MEVIGSLNLTDEDARLLIDVLGETIEVQESLIVMFIEEDQTPETVEEFLEAVAATTDFIAALRTLQERVRSVNDGSASR